MSTHYHRPDRRTAEQMLDGAPAADGTPLYDLLAVAAAPARDSELVGEHAAVTAFRAARLATADQPRRMTKLFSAKLAAVVAVLAVVVGGVATAAATGHLPGPLGGNSPVPPARSSDPSSSAAPPPTSLPTTTERRDDPTSTPSTSSPSPSMTGLCNAFTAGAGSEHGKALDSPAFAALITTAGGRDRVDAYCAELLGDQPGKGPTTTKENNRGGQGNGPPSSHPAPGPDHPKGKPDR
jgi:hypothetical protein